jgi:hypothetical protein
VRDETESVSTRRRKRRRREDEPDLEDVENVAELTFELLGGETTCLSLEGGVEGSEVVEDSRETRLEGASVLPL